MIGGRSAQTGQSLLLACSIRLTRPDNAVIAAVL
jgi:hypothetical protein